MESSDVASMARDSELCRSAVSEQLSEELASITMSSDAKKVAYEQRYRFCMTEKGHSVPAAVTL
ncbi:MAG: hypothetical protein ISR49_17420 [Alphaproteobacteria bacterium]|nr:hypothetical protein [Alphaproteobacteria bacterium]